MERKLCLVCGSSKFRLVIRREFPRHNICKNCGFVYMSPVYNQKKIESLYESEYWEDRENETVKINSSVPQSKLREKELFYWLKEYIKPDSHILEVGCGPGILLKYMRERLKANYYGLEPSGTAVELVRRDHMTCYQSTLEKFDSEPNVYDIIIASHVLEHFQNPDAAIEKIKYILKPNGLLLLEVPNILQPNPKKHLKNWFSKEHLSYFSKNKLEFILVNRKFKIIKSLEQNFVRIIVQNDNDFKKKPNLRNEYYLVLIALWIHEIKYYTRRVRQKLLK